MAFSKCMNFKSLFCTKEFFSIWSPVDLKRIWIFQLLYTKPFYFKLHNQYYHTMQCNLKIAHREYSLQFNICFCHISAVDGAFFFKDHFSPLFFCAKMEKLTKVLFLWVGDAFSIMRYSAFSPTFSTGFNLQLPKREIFY